MRTLSNGNLLQFGEFELDSAKKVLRRDGEIVPLPLKAAELLSVLVENHGEVVTKAALMEEIWADTFVEDSVLTQNIYLLRKTLKSDRTEISIKNVPRRGYVFDAPVNHAHETVMERHLFERVEIEEIEEKQAAREKETKSPLSRLATRRSLIFTLIVFAAAVTLAAGAYFYFPSDSRMAAVSSSPPLKLKPVSVPSRVKTLAVLPFRSSEANFGTAFSDDLSIRLGSINKFTVKPVAFVNECAKTGAELRVDFVLDGNLQSEKNSFAANVRLIDAKSNTEIWAGKFEYAHLIQLQDAVANNTAKELLNQLTDVERELMAARLPTNLSAYRNFQTGHALWRRRADGSAYLRKAIELDASFALAYALMANIKATAGLKGSPAAKEAEELLNKAFALDENLADAYAVQGFIRIFHHRDWDGAERSLKNALELDGNNINARHWLGVYYSIHRRLEEAKVEMHGALELDPTNPTLLADIGQLHYFAGENDLAAEYINRALAIDPNHGFATQYLSLIISSSQQISNKDAILNEVNKATDGNAFSLPYMNVDPRYDAVRGDYRFQAILRKMNFSE